MKLNHEFLTFGLVASIAVIGLILVSTMDGIVGYQGYNVPMENQQIIEVGPNEGSTGHEGCPPGLKPDASGVCK